MKGVASKTNYIEGEFFDISGFAAKITYSDGSTDWIFEQDLTYRETAPLTANNKYVTFDYAGFACMYPIIVTPISTEPIKNIVGIEFSSTKTDFLALETVDPAIFSAGIIYSDGTIEPLDLSLCTIYPAITEPLTSAVTMYTLAYSDGTTTYSDTISVNVAPILSIELSGIESAKLYESTPFAAPSGLTVTAYYDEAKTVSRIVDNYTVSADTVLVTPNDQNKTKITITVDALTTEAELEVLPIVNYSILTPKTAFYYGDLFPLSGFTVTAHYADGTTYDVSDQVIWNAPEVIVAGSKVTASHNGFDLKDFIPFTLPEGTLSIITEPTKTHYEIGEIFDTTGLSVGINYTDGGRKILSIGEYELFVNAPLTAADKNVIVSYFGASTNISISVGD
ncbi:MAG: bacterial Ig-like domain-containing protein, partial [Clostridia bacterium]|nr:bacterial Ig-like domain-containing protein [Clostridia bacterium]